MKKSIFGASFAGLVAIALTTGSVSAHEIGARLSTGQLSEFRVEMQGHLTTTLKEMQQSIENTEPGGIAELSWECPIIIQVLAAVSTGELKMDQARPLIADAVLRDSTNATSAMLNGYSLMSKGVSVHIPISEGVNPKELGELLEIAIEVVNQ